MARKLFIALAVACLLLAFFSCSISKNGIKEGWYNDKRLRKAGYVLTVPHGKSFYLRHTTDSNKINIQKIKP